MAYPSYNNYETTLAPWLYKRPSAWEERKLKFCVDLINEKVPAQESNLEFMGLEHIESWTGKKIFDPNSQSDGVATKFKHNDILFGKLRPYLAKVYKAEQEGLATTEALILRCGSDVEPDFLKYYLLSSEFIDVVDGSTYGSKMPRANYDFIGNLSALIPENEEQTQIAKFLDFKTAQIDRLIEKKKALIEKLNEQRVAMITQAVTKGLNPDAPMKDSEVDWLGEVPEHWKIKPLKFSFNNLNNRRIPLSAEERTGMPKNYRYYGASGVIDMVENYLFDEPTVLIGEDGANLLSRSTPLAFEATGKYWVNNHAHILSPIEGPFTYWSNLLCIVQYDPWITGSAQPKLTKDNLGSILLPRPPVDEQHSIARFISKTTSKIDPMIDLAKKTINKLEEYRTSLITAAVTGKIDVREVNVPEGF